MPNEGARLVIAIDIGTVQSAVAVSYDEPGGETYKSCVDGWSGQNNLLWSQRVPSVVLYDQNGTVLACGAMAATVRNEQEGPHYYVQHFKMHLHPKRIVEENDLPLEALPPNVNITKVYTDYMAYLIDNTQKHLQNYLLRDVWAELHDKTEVILTHPNYWGSREQDILGQAAVNAKLISEKRRSKKLHFVEEAEASASYLMSGRAALVKRLTAGITFIICDAGGSTADVSAYKVLGFKNGKTVLEEVDLPSCEYAGGVLVDKRCENYLFNALSTAQIEDDIVEEAVYDGLTNFQEASKLSFSSSANPSNIKIGGIRMNHEGLRVRRGVMTVPGADMEQFFQPSVQKITATLRERVGANRIEFILLAGGFGDNPYLKNSLTTIFAAECQVLSGNPTNSKPVAIGALNLLIGEPGSVIVHRKNRTWKTWVTDFTSKVKMLVGSG